MRNLEVSVYLPRHGLMDEGLCEFTLKIPREKKKKKKSSRFQFVFTLLLTCFQ